MGFKNMFKKSSKLFDREGFYIILFICLCIVAVTAVVISKNNAPRKAADGTKTQLEEPTDRTDYVTDSEKNNPTAPAMNPPDKSDNKNTSSTSTTSGKTNNTSNTSKTGNVNAQKKIKLVFPVEGDIRKAFSNEELQFSESMQQWETHEGIDIAAELGTDVKAAADGKVVKVFNDDSLADILKTGFGMTVVIQHAGGIETVYCNLAEDVKVKVGDSVKKGQVIGVVGDTATRETPATEGSHLHFAVLKISGNKPITVNPQDYLE